MKFAFNASPTQFAEPGFRGLARRRAETRGPRSRPGGDRDHRARGNRRRGKGAPFDRGVARDRESRSPSTTPEPGITGSPRSSGSAPRSSRLTSFSSTGSRRTRARSALVQMLVDVAREFGMKTVAEGVESEEELAALHRLGVDEVQGFFLCKPLDADKRDPRTGSHHQAVHCARDACARPMRRRIRRQPSTRRRNCA